jgi:hypothetical protein
MISTLAASFISLDRQMSVKFAPPQIILGAFLPQISHLAQSRTSDERSPSHPKVRISRLLRHVLRNGKLLMKKMAER